jgi:hypothetical protein
MVGAMRGNDLLRVKGIICVAEHLDEPLVIHGVQHVFHPPDSCIMAVGKIKEVVVRKDHGFDVSLVMKVTLSCDHRSVDGALGAAFLQTFKRIMENPVSMLL